jgi:hypothetical protein
VRYLTPLERSFLCYPKPLADLAIRSTGMKNRLRTQNGLDSPYAFFNLLLCYMPIAENDFAPMIPSLHQPHLHSPLMGCSCPLWAGPRCELLASIACELRRTLAPAPGTRKGHSLRGRRHAHYILFASCVKCSGIPCGCKERTLWILSPIM